jgi:YesN/AraC family two-component response regulator
MERLFLNRKENEFEYSDARVIMAIQVVREQYSVANLTLNKVSRRIGISEWYLSRLFKRITGCRFKAYLKKVRMERAEGLLQSKDLKINQVATAVGYNYVCNFNRDFNSIYGISPTEYRLHLLMLNLKDTGQELQRMAETNKK